MVTSHALQRALNLILKRGITVKETIFKAVVIHVGKGYQKKIQPDNDHSPINFFLPSKLTNLKIPIKLALRIFLTFITAWKWDSGSQANGNTDKIRKTMEEFFI